MIVRVKVVLNRTVVVDNVCVKLSKSELMVLRLLSNSTCSLTAYIMSASREHACVLLLPEF